MANKNNIKLGDHVVFSKTFLRSIAAKATDPMWREKGKVVALEGTWLAVLDGFRPTEHCHCQCDKDTHADGSCATPNCGCQAFDGRARVNINNLARRGSIAANFDRNTD